VIDRKKMIVSDKSKTLIKLIVNYAKKSISKWGVASVDDILFKVKDLRGYTEDRSLIITVLNMIKGFRWLDNENGWFWLSSVPRNRVSSQIKKILSVSNTIDISELRAGVARHHRMEGFSPPRRVLLELCRHISWCQVDGSTITSSSPLNWKEVLADIEGTLCSILKEHGPVMRREALEEICLNSGMNHGTFYAHLSYSPIIAKYAAGVYGLRGSRIYPGYIESLIPPRKIYKILEDFGWTNEGKIWLALKLSKATIHSGVFNVPSAMKEFLQGNYTLKTVGDTFIGELTINCKS
jgi:hypothetical protein